MSTLILAQMAFTAFTANTGGLRPCALALTAVRHLNALLEWLVASVAVYRLSFALRIMRIPAIWAIGISSTPTAYAITKLNTQIVKWA